MTEPEQKKLAITHASGLLAEALLDVMAASGFDPERVVLLDRAELAGNRLAFGSTYLDVQDQLAYDYEDLMAVLLLEPDSELEDLLQHAECHVISHHRDDPAQTFFNAQAKSARLPDEPSAIQLPSAQLSTLLVVLQSIHQHYALRNLNVVNVLSASFFGKAGVEELAGQTISLLNSKSIKSTVFPLQMAFNMFATESAIDQEQQIVDALQADDVKCSVQELVVPAFHGMAISVSLETGQPMQLSSMAERLNTLPGVSVQDQIVSPVTHCSDSADIIINQLSQPQSDSNRLQFWIFADSVKNGLLQNYQNSIEILLKSFL